MPFKPGQSGNLKGRPKGISAKTKRSYAMEIIFDVFHEFGEDFRERLRKEFKNDPVKAYNKFVKDIQPKHIDLGNADDEPLKIVINDNITNPSETEQQTERDL